MGNIHSVKKSFESLGEEILLINDFNETKCCKALILPGVGAFDPAMINLTKTDLIADLKKWITKFDPENYKSKNFSEEVIDAKSNKVVFKSGEKIKVDASFSDEEGNSRELSNSKEDQLKLLGALRSALDTAKDETKEIVLKAIAIITDESSEPEDLAKLTSKVKTDRSLASAAQHIQDKNTPLTT